MYRLLTIDNPERIGQIELAVGDQLELHNVDATSDEIRLTARNSRKSADNAIELTVSVRGREWHGKIAASSFGTGLEEAMRELDEWLEIMNPRQ